MLTETLITIPRTVATPCNGATRTVTNYGQGQTVVVTSTAVRTAMDGQVTSYWTTTVSATATCHYPLRWSPSFPLPTPVAQHGADRLLQRTERSRRRLLLRPQPQPWRR